MSHCHSDATPARASLRQPSARLQATPIHLTHIFESLEQRVLLSSAVFIPTSTNLHDFHAGPLSKAGSDLGDFYINYRAAQRAGKTSKFIANAVSQTNSANGSPLDVVGNTIGLQLVGVGSLGKFEASMKAMGMTIQSVTAGSNAIAGFIPITLLSQVAQSSNVLHITPLAKPFLLQEGIAPNQADQALNAVEARTTYGINGTGVTVGVISDSVSQVKGGLATSVKTGDLPKNVKVIQDGTPDDTDEGRAILEQIYDLAPGANLDFDTAGDSQQSMVNAINALQAAGCNVIIDDVRFLDEPFFQPGVVDQAINNVTASGVTYVTAAGNYGNSGFEQAATFVAADDGSGDQLVNFNATGTAATRMNVTVTEDGTLTLQWDDAYNGITGTVHADLDIYLYSASGNTLEYSSTDDNFATGVPLEQIPDVAPGQYQVEIRAKSTSTILPRYYQFVDLSELGPAIGNTQYPGTRISVFGHGAFNNGISVGAVDFSDTPAFSNVNPIPTEDFSSKGPAIESRDVNGSLLPTGIIVDAPEVSASDGNNTSFFGQVTGNDPTSLPQFFGTSSASGNAAGVIALLKQADAGATPAQILTALEVTATPVNGASANTYDATGGFGLINAVSAIANLTNSGSGSGGSGGGGTTGPVAPSATIIPVVPNPRATPVTSIDIDFNEAITGFSISDLVLTVNGGANLLTSAQTITSTNDVDFVLGNLSGITKSYGEYTLALVASGSNITGTDGLPLLNGAFTDFLVEAIAGPPAVPRMLTATAASSNTVNLTFEESTGDGLQGLVLERSTNSGFTGKVTSVYLHSNVSSYTDVGLVPGTVYYYQIDGFNTDGASAFSHAATVITLSPGEAIVDNTSSKGVSIVGDWISNSAIPGYDGPDYLQDENVNKGSKSVTYHPNLASAGYYDVYATWTTASDRATNVPFDIFSSSSTLLQTVSVNERSTGGNGWTLLGEYFLHSSNAASVRIRNAGTNGEVIADAVKFLPIDDIERQDGDLTLAARTAVVTKSAITRAVAPTAALAIPPSADDKNELAALRDLVG